jgi:hypothetical protein
VAVAAAVFVFPLSLAAQTDGAAESIGFERDDGPKPIDFGPGPGVPLESALHAERMAAAAEAAPPSGPGASTKGAFGPAVTWPIIPIHAVLLADGRVLTYGTSESGQQGAQFVYDVWNPAQGTGSGSHLVLPNTTGTDLFCSAQSVLAGSGNVLLTGGDRTVNGDRNYSDDATTIFYPKNTASPTLALQSGQTMAFRRWYPSILPLANGDKVILGGRADPGILAPTPELYSESTGWRLLTGANSDAAFGSGTAWYYPRAYKLPNDPANAFVLGHTGNMFHLNPAGSGKVTKLAKTTLGGSHMLPTVMFDAGKLLSVRSNRKVVVVNINGAQPSVTSTADIDQVRYWSNATMLADGKVLVTGGSAVANQLSGVAYAARLWDPATGQWTLGAPASKARLYHSTALLLPDGSVLTAGGGAPGPVKNLNAELYFPPYLYKGARPALSGTPAALSLSKTKTFKATVGTGSQISRVTLLRGGSTTHANNMEQRFQRLAFTQSGTSLTITSPINPNYTLPGYYLLFVFDSNGSPSVARTIKITR